MFAETRSYVFAVVDVVPCSPSLRSLLTGTRHRIACSYDTAVINIRLHSTATSQRALCPLRVAWNEPEKATLAAVIQGLKENFHNSFGVLFFLGHNWLKNETSNLIMNQKNPYKPNRQYLFRLLGVQLLTAAFSKIINIELYNARSRWVGACNSTIFLSRRFHRPIYF